MLCYEMYSSIGIIIILPDIVLEPIALDKTFKCIYIYRNIDIKT